MLLSENFDGGGNCVRQWACTPSALVVATNPMMHAAALLLEGQPAATITLMRSRYASYTWLIDYLVATTLPAQQTAVGHTCNDYVFQEVTGSVLKTGSCDQSKQIALRSPLRTLGTSDGTPGTILKTVDFIVGRVLFEVLYRSITNDISRSTPLPLWFRQNSNVAAQPEHCDGTYTLMLKHHGWKWWY
jgi:hypothetical protein